jgi:hypothetical protein
MVAAAVEPGSAAVAAMVAAPERDADRVVEALGAAPLVLPAVRRALAATRSEDTWFELAAAHGYLVAALRRRDDVARHLVPDRSLRL